MRLTFPERSDPQADAVPLSDEAAVEAIAAASWYHRFEVRPGLMTPGVSDMAAGAALDALGLPADLTGCTALDVGAWDGPLTFELERRGATAFALDIQEPARVGFDAARRITGSRAVHYRGSVYQLPHDLLSGLDHIVFRGVFYHLKYPLLAFECLSAALKMGGRLYFEGETFLHYAENADGTPIEENLSRFAQSEIPLTLCYPNRYKNSSNWFIPNPACLRVWMEMSGLRVDTLHTFTEDGAQRSYGVATKVAEQAEQLEHPLY